MTFGGSPMKTIVWVITEDLSQHHSEWMEMFRCGKEVVEILPIDLTWTGHEIDLTSGHEYKKSEINKLPKYWPHQLLKVWKHWDQNCGCGRVTKLLNCVLKSRHLTWPGDLTWYDLGSKFFYTRCAKDEWIAMRNFAALRAAVFRYLRKTDGGTYVPPRPCARPAPCWGAETAPPPVRFLA